VTSTDCVDVFKVTVNFWKIKKWAVVTENGNAREAPRTPKRRFHLQTETVDCKPCGRSKKLWRPSPDTAAEDIRNARVYSDSSETDVRMPVVLRAVCRRWKGLIDFADDSTYHPEFLYYVDAQMRDIGGPNEVRSDSAWSSYGWTLENLTRALMEW
jgi:hypothetical protein